MEEFTKPIELNKKTFAVQHKERWTNYDKIEKSSLHVIVRKKSLMDNHLVNMLRSFWCELTAFQAVPDTSVPF